MRDLDEVDPWGIWEQQAWRMVQGNVVALEAAHCRDLLPQLGTDRLTLRPACGRVAGCGA